MAQQAAEKALKGLWYWFGEDPWGHSLQRLVQDFPIEQIREKFRKELELAARLDRFFYIPPRYPNGLPDSTPGQNYFQQDGDQAMEAARHLLRCTEKHFQ